VGKNAIAETEHPNIHPILVDHRFVERPIS
jgi:hypothetical protein